MKAYLGLCASLLAAGVAVAPASAVTVAAGNYTFTFQGVCTDCAGFATASLKVQNYVLGTNLNTSNFLSFTYNGTNLVPAFTLNSVTNLTGNLNIAIGSYNLFIDGGSLPFRTDTSGNWRLGNPAADYGTNGTLAGSPTGRDDPSPAPEPASWAMMIAGFGAIGAALRHRKIAIRFA